MYYEKAKKAATTMGRQVIVKEFIKEMDMAYACADIVVSRAGAIAISELAIAGKAVIFIPLPTAAAGHQKKNAMALAEKNAAVLIDDKDAQEELNKAVDSIARNKKSRESLEEAIKAFAFKDAADKIALEVIKLINKKT
jgi:UDP-N-acetylglucosamine--N-acetylmuramyl-(pentapeptide) pyrophosphoryl-undecaprenol N-acetylglucosamine transferase